MVKQEMTTEVCDRKVNRVRLLSGVIMVILGVAAVLLLGMDLWSPGSMTGRTGAAAICTLVLFVVKQVRDSWVLSLEGARGKHINTRHKQQH